jgi:Flp pilus assembly protein TadG
MRAASGDITLTSAGAITEDGDAATVAAGNVLTASAAGGIALDTSVDSITASTSAAGDIDIDETDAVTLTSVSTHDGSVTVDAGGAIVATSVDTSNTDDDANDISLTTTGWEYRSGIAGCGRLGDITLTSAGAITEDGDAATVAAGNVLTASCGRWHCVGYQRG